MVMLDLRKAYLQLHVDADLQRFQAVRYKGKTSVLTRLGFGLAPAPKIMTRVLGKVLSLREDVRLGTDSYIDDILVDTSVVSAAAVKAHLERYGLVSKDPVPIQGVRVLGLQVYERDGDKALMWRRDNNLPEWSSDSITKRQLFSVCGQLVGHYPVVGWLRVWCSYLKRAACEGSRDRQAPVHVKPMLSLRRVAKDNPAKGLWNVPRVNEGKVWFDASSLATGVCLEVDGCVVEDG